MWEYVKGQITNRLIRILIQTARVKFVYMQFLLERGKEFLETYAKLLILDVTIYTVRCI